MRQSNMNHEKTKEVYSSPLENPCLKKPYGTVPDGYWMQLEDAVHQRIHPVVEPSPSLWERMKSSVFLALSFCVILGFGYGVMWMTGTSQKSDYAEVWDLSALVEEGYIHPYWIDHHYEYFLSEEEVLYDQNTLDINLNEQEILEYFYE